MQQPVLSLKQKSAHTLDPSLNHSIGYPLNIESDLKPSSLSSNRSMDVLPLTYPTCCLNYNPPRQLRSTGTNLLVGQMWKPRKNYGHDFSYFAQKYWNNLPQTIRLSETQDFFKKALKTHLFTIACTEYF